jgi:hypothetical protein
MLGAAAELNTLYGLGGLMKIRRGLNAAFFALSLVSSSHAAAFKTIVLKTTTDDFIISDGNERVTGHSTSISYMDFSQDRFRIESEGSGSLEKVNQNNKISIFTDDTLYVFDPKTNEALKFGADSFMSQKFKESALMMENDTQYGTPTREESLLGRSCKVYDSGSIVMWVYKGILLKSELRTPVFRQAMETTEIQEDVPISDEMFHLPSSAVIKAQ